jgi:hypothetical protein
MPAHATLQDVATRTGVHRTTVSLALRDHPRIPAETRARVRAAAEALGYRINPLVSALMQSRRTGRAVKHVTLAYVTNYPTRYGWRPPHHDRRISFRVQSRARCQFSYSEDGRTFAPLGGEFAATPGRWVGAKLGLFAVAPTSAPAAGHADFDWFRVTAP